MSKLSALRVLGVKVNHRGNWLFVRLETDAGHFGYGHCAADRVAPHNPAGPIATRVSAELAATLPNPSHLELAWGEASFRSALLDPPEKIADGLVELPPGPGFGIAFNEAVLAKQSPNKNLRARSLRSLLVGAALVGLPALALAEEPSSPALRAQVDAERRALHLLARTDIQQSLKSLAAEWRDKSPGLLPETYAQLRTSIQEVGFFVALQVVDGDPRRPEVIEISAAPHRWFGSTVSGGRWGINNPDTLYFTVPVELGSSYVLHGQRHGAGPTDANFTLQTPDVFGAVDNVGLRSLEVAPDGSYRITVDDQPANGRRNHLQIRGGATQLLIRNTLADWAHETPDALTVERVAGPDAEPPSSEEALAKEVIRRAAAVVAHSANDLQPPIFQHPSNLIPEPGALADKPGFLVTQRNALGHFRLADDEALVATFNPGGAGYATFPITNVWGVSPDSRAHQNSLNTKQATPNPDGTITVVVANWDPGIANWVDPAGLREGIVMLRWQLLAAQTGASSGPSVTARLVKRSELPNALSESVQRITPQGRRERAKRRAAGFDRRFTAR